MVAAIYFGIYVKYIIVLHFLTEDEIYNRKLQLQYVLKRSKNFLSYSNMELSNCTLHMYNYMWAYNMVKHDIVLCGKIKEYSENIKTGLIVTPKFRNHHSILYKILQSKLKMLADI